MFVVLTHRSHRHFVEDRLDRRVGFEQCSAHCVLKFFRRLAHLFLRSLHRWILHRLLMCCLHLFAFIRREIGKAPTLMLFRAFLRLTCILTESDWRDLQRGREDRDRNQHFHSHNVK